MPHKSTIILSQKKKQTSGPSVLPGTLQCSTKEDPYRVHLGHLQSSELRQ